ncbi:Transposase [Shigella dysenteriae 1617]|uniref:Transposase n=1 Tax=Shigella dysenteriae 1617 TaxID=754093 RepID=A0A0A6ZUT4_SHIDY|nr:Transposase [Shigella dysenteriae 1617]
MRAFEVLSWPALTFIVLVVSEMAFNGAGVRDTARTLKIGINTVIRTLKNSRQSE